MELGQLVVAPVNPRHHTHTLIFLHGRGDTPDSMTESLLRWSRSSRRKSLVDVFPTVRWVFPQAETRVAASGGHAWPQWFDIWNVLDMSDSEELQAPGLRDSVASVRRIVRNEARKVGGLDRVVLSGISQGGAAAVHALLHLGAVAAEELEGGWLPERPAEPRVVRDLDEPPPPARLAGLVCFSCWLPFPGGSLEETREVIGLGGAEGMGGKEEEEKEEEEEEEDEKEKEEEEDEKEEDEKDEKDEKSMMTRRRYSDEIVQHTPAFLGHCADDPLVFPEYGRQLRDELRGFGMRVEWNEYPDGGHWINSPQGIDDVVKFLKAQGIPADESI